MDITGREADRDRFRAQPLRNVVQIPPYFHDGAVANSGDAVAVMAKVQLGKSLTPEAIRDIVAFLDALAGALPSHYAPATTD
jgi:cytochrome c peroxidase